jgi:general secretion pathway protein L
VVAGSGRYTLEGLEYRAGTLELVVTAADVAALDQLRESLASIAPLQVELTAATPGSRGVEGRLRVRGGAA